MKSTLKRAIVTLAVIGLLVVVPSMCGTWTQLSKQGRRVWHDVGVGMGLIAEPQPVSLSVIIKPDGSCTTNDKEWAPPVAVKTQVYDSAQTVSGGLAVRNQTWLGIRAPTNMWEIAAGGFYLRIVDVTENGWSGPDPQPAPPAGTAFTFAAVVKDAALEMYEAHEFYYLPVGGPYDIELPYSITVTGQRLTRTESTTYGAGRDGKPVYAKEVTETDAWENIRPMSWDLTFGNLSSSGTQTGSDPMWEPDIAPVTGISITIAQANGATGVSYADVTVVWSACDLDFSGMGKTVSPLRATGSGPMISIGAVSDFTMPTSQVVGHQVGIFRPYLPDFSEFAVVDRGGELIDTLRIEGGFKVDKRHAWTLPYGDPGTTIYPTVAEIRAIGQYSTPPGVTGLDYEDTDYEHQLWTPPLSFAINAASARAHKLI